MILTTAPALSATVYLVSSERNESYEQALNALEQSIKASSPTLNIQTRALNTFTHHSVNDDDLIVCIGEDAAEAISTQYKKNALIYSFISPQSIPSSMSNWAATVSTQPIEIMTKVMDPLVENQYKNDFIVAHSSSNKPVIQALKNRIKLEHGKLIAVPIPSGEKPAKYIEEQLFKAGALIAVQDAEVWRGENARWMLYQAYRYKVPVVGYSQKFLKAGALVSIYSTVEQIALKTAQLVQQWEQNGKIVDKGIIYSNYNIEFNKNIARALNMDVPENEFNIEPLK